MTALREFPRLPHETAAIQKRAATAAAAGGDASTIGPGKFSRLFPSTAIANGEREELHREIYGYFAWLEKSLVASESSKRAYKVGMSVTGIKGILKAMEAGLKSLREDSIVLNAVAEDTAKKGRAPFLERCCGEELKQRVAETKESNSYAFADPNYTKTWEERCADLNRHRDSMNKSSYQELNQLSPGLGDWLKKQRHLYSSKDANFMKKRYVHDIVCGVWRENENTSIRMAPSHHDFISCLHCQSPSIEWNPRVPVEGTAPTRCAKKE